MKFSQLIEPGTHFMVIVPEDCISQRLDRFLHETFSAYSRTYFQALIENGSVKVNNTHITKSHCIVKSGSRIDVQFPELTPLVPSAQSIDHLGVAILFEHQHFFIVNKPAGVLTHAAPTAVGEATLVDWLVTYCAELKDVGMPDRPGIVHRLDKDTSGLLVIPRNNYAHALLSDMFKNRLVKKTYLALVQGHAPQKGSIDYRIARHPSENRMTHQAPHGRDSLTHFTAHTYYKNHTLVTVAPVTGRTHQIRVHLTAIGLPLEGDLLYGSASKIIGRHALHAHTLAFSFEGKEYSFEAPIPQDMLLALAQLEPHEHC